MCGVGSDEFWNLTPHEMRLISEGVGKRIEVQQELLAWHAANTLAPWGRVTPGQLLGRRALTDGTIDEAREKLRELQEGDE